MKLYTLLDFFPFAKLNPDITFHPAHDNHGFYDEVTYVSYNGEDIFLLVYLTLSEDILPDNLSRHL